MSAITSGSMGRPFLTVAEAADELAVTEPFIRKLIADGASARSRSAPASSASAEATSKTSSGPRT